MWQAMEINGRIRRARDAETGALMWLEGTREIDVNIVKAELSDKSKLWFAVGYKPKGIVFSGNDPSNPMIKLYVGAFQSMLSRAKRASVAVEDNTRLVNYLITGLAVINRKWPLCGSPYFYSDLGDYRDKGIHLADFNFPSDDELARLSPQP